MVTLTQAVADKRAKHAGFARRAVKALRKHASSNDLGNRELSDKIGAARNSITNWMKGDAVPTPDKLQKIVNFMAGAGVELPKDLLRYSEKCANGSGAPAKGKKNNDIRLTSSLVYSF